MTGVKTDEKKQHFDDIYIQSTPVAFKTEIFDKLSYVSDDFNRQVFERLILPKIEGKKESVKVLDLCSCFGNTTMATIYGMTYSQICENWKDEATCMTIQGQRRIPNCHVTGVDLSQSALDYGKKVGLYDSILQADLNQQGSPQQLAVLEAMKETDFWISTAALVYLDVETIEAVTSAFASGSSKEGYVLVNFLNPFALEKADETKRILLKHLEFVGSMASRHRKLSELERSNYPGEEWALLELWVLKRRSN